MVVSKTQNDHLLFDIRGRFYFKTNILIGVIFGLITAPYLFIMLKLYLSKRKVANLATSLMNQNMKTEFRLAAQVG